MSRQYWILTHNQFRVSINGAALVAVQIALPADVSGANSAATWPRSVGVYKRKYAPSKWESGNGKFHLHPAGNKIMMTSGASGEMSSVQVMPGERNDASTRLKLGTLNGGIETDAAAAIRPVEMPDNGT